MISTLLVMSPLPIHQNLSTSFVNLSALVRHLRGLQFIGKVKIEMSSYEADIDFAADGKIEAREHDHIANRISIGESALQRIMIRAREDGGLIHVYLEPSAEERKSIYIDKTIANEARKMAAATAEGSAPRKINMETRVTTETAAETPIPMPDVSFDSPSTESWSELLGLISELLQTVDNSLTKANFDFAGAFRNACGFVSFEHPFLDPDSDVFSYEDGYISVRRRLGDRELISGVMAALSRIMSRLCEDPYFGSVYHQTMHKLRVLANRRRPQYELFNLGREIEKIIGI